MTQQGKRQARFRTWGGSMLTYNGDMMCAGQVASGQKEGTVNELERYIHRAITGSDATTLSGLQAATAEYLGVPGGWDAVGDELPLRGWDFTSGGAFPGLMYGNLVSGPTSRDGLYVVSSGVARASSLGLLVERQYTNKCTNTNWTMTDTSGTNPGLNWNIHEAVPRSSWPSEMENQVAALEKQNGVQQVNITHAYRSRCTTADTITVNGATGNTNVHTPNVRVFALTGDPGIALTGSASARVSQLNTLERLENPLTPSAGTNVLTMTASQPSEFYWFDNNLTESPGRVSSIQINGSAVTRLGDAVSAVIPAGLNVANFAVVSRFQKFLAPPPPNDSRITHIDSGFNTTGTKLEDVVIHTNLIQQVRDGTAPGFVSGPAYTLDSIVEHVYGLDGTTLRYVIDGVEQTPSVTIVPPVNYTTLRLGTRATNDRQTDGYLRQAHIATAAGGSVIDGYIG